MIGAATPGAPPPFETTYSEQQLLDIYAGLALAGMIGTVNNQRSCDALVPACWGIAEAMIAERRRRQKGNQP